MIFNRLDNNLYCRHLELPKWYIELYSLKPYIRIIQAMIIHFNNVFFIILK